MYITPNTTIRLLRNAPLDNTYRNTIYFGSATSQQNYFASLTKYNLQDYSYQRYQRGIRVGIVADNLYDCNYVMFQNSSFGNKWFYAFITSVEYVNNETSYIELDLDVMQTWFFDYTVNPSFIEREHSVTDDFWENLVPENLELGEYICHNFDGTNRLGNMSIVIAATFDDLYNDRQGGVYGGIYSGLYYNVFKNELDANSFIEGATARNLSGGIVSVFMMPSDFIIDRNTGVATYDVIITQNKNNLDGYAPRNKKLFSYPYNFLYVTNLDGNAAEYHYEYFDNTTNCTFGLAMDMSCNPQAVLWPTNYKGITANFNEKIVLGGFPQCPYTTDSFKAWLAQNGSSLAVNAMGSAVSMAGSIASGNPWAAAQGALGIAGTVAQVYQHSTLPRQAHGATGSITSSALGIKDFAMIRMSIRAEFAKIIDDYFSMFGYATHRVKKPNLNSRPHWNYIKTRMVSLTGSVPADDLARLRGIYDEGITFWNKGSEVGNYNLNNSPGEVG